MPEIAQPAPTAHIATHYRTRRREFVLALHDIWPHRLAEWCLTKQWRFTAAKLRACERAALVECGA